MAWIRNQEAYIQKKQATVNTTVHVVAKECFSVLQNFSHRPPPHYFHVNRPLDLNILRHHQGFLEWNNWPVTKVLQNMLKTAALT